MTKIRTFLKIEPQASYVHQKKAKIIQKLVLGLKIQLFGENIDKKMIY